MEKFAHSNLVREVAATAGVSQVVARSVLKAAQDVTYNHVSNGEKVVLFDGLTLGTVYRGSRNTRNPRTGEAIVSTPHMAPKAFFGAKYKAVASEVEVVEA